MPWAQGPLPVQPSGVVAGDPYAPRGYRLGANGNADGCRWINVDPLLVEAMRATGIVRDTTASKGLTVDAISYMHPYAYEGGEGPMEGEEAAALPADPEEGGVAAPPGVWGPRLLPPRTRPAGWHHICIRAISGLATDIELTFTVRAKTGCAGDAAAINIVLPPPLVTRRIRAREVAVLYDGPWIRDKAPGVDCGYQYNWTYEYRPVVSSRRRSRGGTGSRYYGPSLVFPPTHRRKWTWRWARPAPSRQPPPTPPPPTASSRAWGACRLVQRPLHPSLLRLGQRQLRPQASRHRATGSGAGAATARSTTFL